MSNTKVKHKAKRLLGVGVCFLVSIGVAFLLQPKFHGNSDAMNTLVTVFSILAGFLIAVIAMVADERMLGKKSSRHDRFHLIQIKNELIGHRYLFYTYLVILGLAFLVSLDVGWPDRYQRYSEIVLLTLASFALSRSFLLPGCLSKKYTEVLDRAIKNKELEEKEAAKGARNLPPGTTEDERDE
ncbi:hypothetical protein FZZ93_02450 [Halomonas eurihalina]|uniref:Uncharacterized protein n=1 Tax=Halomonas eurihalina TaxID=42566 RepID=A0A5D9DE51_HALER|nr:hypothetical protein [Halomonas eurihalina]MDR5857945.1 hypothetical protein [Halomonas eurihalina]TZG41542.1 hypothetical protein FZZ93_02450 [Halomonas eurihalina]